MNSKIMTEALMWLSEKEASEVLRVDEQTLVVLRERGYLRPGTHWRSSEDHEQTPWNPKVSYRINGCREVIKYAQANDASFDQMAA